MFFEAKEDHLDFLKHLNVVKEALSSSNRVQ